MAILPIDWNAVIIGAWNVAILTPDGIRKRLFQVPDDTPIDVQVAVDRPAPHRIHYNGLTVTPSSKLLVVSVDECSKESLKNACDVAKRAVTALPETPISAVGVNIRYQVEVLPDELLNLIEMPLDERLSDSGFVIRQRMIQRSLGLDPGLINLQLNQEQTTQGTILFNFHLDSQEVETIGNWLTRVDEFYEKSQALLGIMKLSTTEGEAVNV